MRVADRTSGITAEDLLAVARTFGVKRPERHLDAVRAALERWPSRAEELGVPASTRDLVTRALAERRAQVGP